jgi:PglZ domain
MSTHGSLRDWLCLAIREVLGHQSALPRLLLWCDPDRSWLDLLREAARADGFELWAPLPGQEDAHELLVRDQFYSAPPAPRVVWLPCARDGIAWFKAFELEAEEVWEKSLLQALREYGVDISRDHEDDLVGLLPAHAREWFDKPKETWKELTPGNAKGTLVDDHRMLQVLAGPKGEFEQLREEGRFDIFARRATEDYGLPDPKTLDEDAWRVAVTARLLCTDAAEGWPHEPPREADKIISPGLPRTHALKMLRQWHHDIRFIANFERLVPLAEATVGLGYWARNLSAMPRSRSSHAVEQTLFSLTSDRLERLEDVDLLAEELERNAQTYKDRQQGFWGKDATNRVVWGQLVELADVAAMLVQNRDAEAAWKTLQDAIDWYAGRGWQLDQAGEDLFKEASDLPQQLHRIRARLRRGYLRTMDRIGRVFSELLSKSPEKLAALPTAGEVALEELESQSTPTALIFLDACRLDFGWRLAGLLNEGEPVPRASVRTAIAPIPSITALGMAFALPVKREKLHVDLSADQKTFVVTADGFDGDLKWAEQRRKWLVAQLDVKEWLEIADVLDGENLKKKGRSRKLIAVHADELDSHDGQLKLTGADEHLRRYVQAIRKLREAGFNRVIVVTDHGFFHWQPGDHEIEDELPKGKVLWKHRRAMVGHDLSHPSAVRMKVPRSSLEVVVPRSTSAFLTYGALGFFHGGATLQEIVIPVVVASWPAKARKVKVVLKPVGYVASEAPRVQVQAASTGRLFSTDSNLLSRRVLVKIKDASSGKVVFRHSEAMTIEPDGPVVTIQLTIVSPKPEMAYGSPLVVEVLDADDEELLIRENAELKIEITEW